MVSPLPNMSVFYSVNVENSDFFLR